MDLSQKLSRRVKEDLNKITLRKGILFVVLFSLCFWLSTGFWKHFTISRTDSAGAHFFYYSKNFNPDEITQNQFVMFPVVTKLEPLCWPKACNMIKRVGCDEGGKLVTSGKEFYCNGFFLGKAKDFSKRGDPLTAFHYNGIIPQGYAFMVNDHKDSYDSRYYGLVQKKNVSALVTPLF